MDELTQAETELFTAFPFLNTRVLKGKRPYRTSFLQH